MISAPSQRINGLRRLPDGMHPCQACSKSKAHAADAGVRQGFSEDKKDTGKSVGSILLAGRLEAPSGRPPVVADRQPLILSQDDPVVCDMRSSVSALGAARCYHCNVPKPVLFRVGGYQVAMLCCFERAHPGTRVQGGFVSWGVGGLS